MLNCFGVGLVTKSRGTLVTLWTVAGQAPLSLGFPRQEYWSRLLFPSPGDIPNPGIEPTSLALEEDSLPLHQTPSSDAPTPFSHRRGWIQRHRGTAKKRNVLSFLGGNF